MSFDQDVEKSDDKKRTSIVNGFEEDSEHAVHAETFEVGDTMYAKLQRFAGKLNIEQRGIERVCFYQSYTNIYIYIYINDRRD